MRWRVCLEGREGWGNPSTHGTMTLSGRGEATFTSDAGRRAVFAPLPPARLLNGLPARLTATGPEIDVCK